MLDNLEVLKNTEEANASFSFAEYQSIREPAVNVIVNDFAQKYIEREEKNGKTVTMEEAREIARKEIPSAFVPEWMKNLRVSANIAGTELIYLEQLLSALHDIQELLRVIGDEKIESYIERHQSDFKRIQEAQEVKEGE